MRIFTFAASLFLAFTAAAFAEQQIPATLTIQATGTVAAAPDKAAVGFTVHSTARDAQDAMRQNNESMNAAFAVLEAAGIDKRDISTNGLSLQPQYRPNTNAGYLPPEIVGYIAQNNVTVTVRNLAEIGSILDALVGARINGINRVDFDVSNAEELENQARAMAARAARERAEIYAAAIGTSITGIQSMHESSHMQPAMAYGRMEMMSVAASDVPVSGGEVNLSVSLNVVFTLDGILRALPKDAE